jgi:phosphatidylglycerophosphate synthase
MRAGRRGLCYDPPMNDAPYTPTKPDQLFPLTRHFSYLLTPALSRTPLTPNQITALSMLAGLAGAWCFTKGLWAWSVAGGLLLVVCYTLDNCDGEIARIKKMSSEWGAHFDDLVDWLVDSAFFAGLGWGVWVETGNMIWLWFGLAAAFGATLDYIIDIVLYARQKKDPEAKTREEEATDVRKPEDWIDWLIYIFHKLSRADFCVIVLGLAAFDIAWLLLPAGAVGAQVYWITDLFKRARGWHT